MHAHGPDSGRGALSAVERGDGLMSIFPTKIMLSTDGSEDAELAATTAVSVAKTTGSELHVLNVETAGEARGVLDEHVRKIENLGEAVARSHARVGDVAKEVVDLAEEVGAGLIVTGSRGRGRIKRLAMGSISDAVVRHAHCPVMVVRWKPVVFPAKILLCTDGSEDAALAAQTATDLVERTGSELHVVHAGWALHRAYSGWPVAPFPPGVSQSELDRGARKLLEAEVERMERAGAEVSQAYMRSGRADEEICVLAEELGANLTVMGCRGQSVVRRALMGSVSDAVVRHAHCPVLVARG